ncbi:hypothetical protein PMZ80_000744 [Knufia obscura]|uniref:WLM domain-containing protein n=2 Tax=Knufia TaxID=430999 RepID=A0AAN8I4E6_9EURO|nr:hypothetical protein PMZ80_000744 [Knufia obscura]KAK5949116.1 hypothetical protein OHC33_009857 [Knufia fluminis]
MPLNTLRLNHQASSHPNERIVFIKPIPRPPAQKDDYDRAEIVLKAIAAQCLPIMKGHYLSVTTLEEYEPNPEFIGRNFNNGEIIQLVIKSKSGAWLPLNMIQMVMMHELAHNTHMNHGKGFWQARNLYANEMRQLWSKGYTGEGLWGSGRALGTLEQVMGNNMVSSEELADLPLCGGTFRSRRKKRKAKGPDLTWKEKRDKRIEKKFGKNGAAVGEDEDKRLALEINRKGGSLGSKPRVAQSKRGRELRAAAALARFGTNKKEVQGLEAAVKKEEDDDETETESEQEYEELDVGQEDAKDLNGRKLLDKKGQGMIRVCEEEHADDVEVKNEMEELANLDSIPVTKPEPTKQSITNADNPKQQRGSSAHSSSVSSVARASCEAPPEESPVQAVNTTQELMSSVAKQPQAPSTTPIKLDAQPSISQPLNISETTCPICSMANNALRSTCIACAHVLDFRKDPRHWSCIGDACKDSEYVNAGDCGICGICGSRKPSTQQQDVQPAHPRIADTRSSHIAYL